MKLAESNNFTQSSRVDSVTSPTTNKDKQSTSSVSPKKVITTSSDKLANVPSSLQLDRLGVTIPIMCSATSSSVKLDEISKVVIEKDEDSCFYDIFVSSASYPCTNGGFDKTKAIEYYQKQQPSINHLGIVEEKMYNGVLSFESDDKTKQYLDEFMCSCKIDYGALRELFISMGGNKSS